MTISMLIEDRLTGQSEEIPVCTNATYQKYWKRLAQEQGLEMIQALGALWLVEEYRDQFLNELVRLRSWAIAHAANDEYASEIVRRVDNITEAVASHPLSRFEISFG